MHQEDLVRELAKTDNVLAQVEAYLLYQNKANAALHLSEKVLLSPLATAVQNQRIHLQWLESQLGSVEQPSNDL